MIKELSPMNRDRATWARVALVAFGEETGVGDEEYETQISDLVADLKHLCDAEGVDWNEVVRRSDDHYAAETSEKCGRCDRLYDPAEQGAGDDLCPDCN